MKNKNTRYTNRNENLINKVDIKNTEIYWDDFKYKKYFIKICDIKPNKKTESLEAFNIQNIDNFNKKESLVYAFCIDGKLIKIGSTITPFSNRLQSYNTGKTRYRIAGKNSTTNWFCLQSFILINKNVEVYAFFTGRQQVDVFGEKVEVSFNPKYWERHILTEMTLNKQKPIFCTQN